MIPLIWKQKEMVIVVTLTGQVIPLAANSEHKSYDFT